MPSTVPNIPTTSNMQPFGHYGPFRGMLTLPPAEFVPADSFVDLYNCIVDGGKVTVRPGLTGSVSNIAGGFTTVRGSINLPAKIVVDTTPGGTASDVVYYTFGTGGTAGVSSVRSDGSSPTALFTFTGARTAVDLDHTTSPKKLYMSATDAIYSGNSDGSGAITTVLTKTGFNIQSMAVWAAQDRIYYGSGNTGNSATSGLWRSTRAGGSDTQLVPGVVHGLTRIPTGMSLDVSGGYLYVSVHDGVTPAVGPRIARYTVTGSESASDFSNSLVSSTTTHRPIAVHFDSASGRLYWIEYDGTGVYYIRSSIPTSGGVTGLNLNPVQTHYVLSSGFTASSVFNDGSGNVLYLTNNIASAIASAGSIVRSDASSSAITSTFWWKRSRVGIEAANTVGDLMFVQLMNTTAGGSTFHAYFPTTGNSVALTPGYTRGTSNAAPDLFVMPTRTADPTATDPFIPAGDYCRVSCAYTAGGLDSSQGGVLVGTPSRGAYMFNYRVPETASRNEKQFLYVTGNPTGGTFQLILNTANTANIPFSTNSTTFASNIQTALNNLLGPSSVTVTVPGSVNYFDSTSAPAIQIEFTGNGYNDRGLPFLRPTNESLTGGSLNPRVVMSRFAAVAPTLADFDYKGRSYPYGILWLRPCGLPTPATPTVNVVSGSVLTGYYEYAISYYSSQLNVESPLAVAQPVTLSGQMAFVNWTNPSTHYFRDTFGSPRFDGGPVIDLVRVWRRRLGVSATDPTGRDAYFYLVDEVPARRESHPDRRPESGANALDRGRIYVSKSYPPDNAQYVETHDNHAYYGDGDSLTLWVSRGPFIGGVSGGEFGHEYVDASSYFVLDDNAPSDSGITAVRSFGRNLLVWSDDACFVADTLDVDGGGLVVNKLESAPGCASHWCVAASTPLPDLPGGAIFYPHPKGSVYLFDGSSARTGGRAPLRPYIDAFSQVTWKKTTLGAETYPSWYYASACVDPRGNRVILTAPLQNGTFETYTFGFDDSAWTRWSIPATSLVLGRETNSADATYFAVPTVFVGLGNTFAKLREGLGDLGTPISWHALTGKLSADAPFTGKTWGNGGVMVKASATGNAASAQMTVTGYLDGTQRFTTTQTLPGSDSQGMIPFSAHTGIARHFQLRLSGSVGDGVARPELLGYFVMAAPSGVDGRVTP